MMSRSEGEESFTAVIDQQAKSERISTQTEVFAHSILQQGKTEDQSSAHKSGGRSAIAGRSSLEILSPRP